MMRIAMAIAGLLFTTACIDPGDLPGTSTTPDTTVILEGPEVVSVLPIDGNFAIEPDTTIEITFDEAMDPTLGELELNGQPLPASFTWSDDNLTVTLIPDNDLRLGFTHQARVAAGFRSAEGDAALEFTWRFSTPLTERLPAPPLATPTPWQFVDVTTELGLGSLSHGNEDGYVDEHRMMAGGVVAADLDHDEFVDFYYVAGQESNDKIMMNNGDGTFRDGTAASGVSIEARLSMAPAIGDIDGDGDRDLMTTHGPDDPYGNEVFMNNGDGTFVSVGNYGIDPMLSTFGSTLGDYDGDEDLDLFLGHWGLLHAIPEDTIAVPRTSHAYLWENQGNGFVDVTHESGIQALELDFIFQANFSDIDSDGDMDILATGDFYNSRVLRNDGGTFVDTTDLFVITDGNGMGSTIADFDADGDMDWLVTSIWDPDGTAEGHWDVTGNRLYQNNGDGTFVEASIDTGVREGFWGWGACFADLNNDGFQDLMHTNGMWSPHFTDIGDLESYAEFEADPSRIFVNTGIGTFEERSFQLGLNDRDHGTGVSCFDFERDGDIDFLIHNNEGPLRAYRNEGGNSANFINIRLQGVSPNTDSLGSRVWVTTGDRTQMHEIQLTNQYLSQNPSEVHFGLGGTQVVDRIRVEWSTGEESIFDSVAANRFLVIEHPGYLDQPS